MALFCEALAGRAFRTSKSVESRLRLACTGLLPKSKSAGGLSCRKKHFRLRRRPWKTAPADAGSRVLVRGDRGICWTAVDHPSRVSRRDFVSIKLGIDQDDTNKKSKVIGFTSARENEGKSTVALAVQLMAGNGASVIVVDCNLRNPSLTRSVAPNAGSGLVELVAGHASIEDIVWKDESTQLAFLPAVPVRAS